jgi:signal transduction histidine kinase
VDGEVALPLRVGAATLSPPPSSDRQRWYTLAPETWRRDLLRIVLRLSAAVGFLIYVPSVATAIGAGMWSVIVLDTLALGALAALGFSERIPWRARTAATCLVLYLLGAGLLVQVGPVSQIYLLGFSLLTTLFLGLRWGIPSVALNAVTMLAIGYLGFASPDLLHIASQTPLGDWALVTGNFALINLSLVAASGAVIKALESALARAATVRAALERDRQALVDANEALESEMDRRAKLEEQLRQAQKMETVGRLAGGVAHDFNNLMSVVLTYGELISDGLPPADPMRADLEEIQNAGRRAVELTRQLLAFSRQQVLAPRLVDLSAVVRNLESMLARLIGEHIELAARCPPGLPNVLVDPVQVEQVIMNLALNARDAMPDGGLLTIETAAISLSDEYASEHVGVVAGPHVLLAVSDTGSGMDAATREHMFEPFFTTKEQGKGTGLGLATVLGVVKQSGGSINVYSEPGKGASFKVYFPVAEGEAHSRPKPALSTRPSLHGGETVLLVEDERAVRQATRAILLKFGYRVLEASGGSEALALSAGHAGDIDLLLTDVVMPRLNGRELAERLSRERPKMKALFMSGYTDDAVVRHGLLEASIDFIQKPLTPEALALKLREVLDADKIS